MLLFLEASHDHVNQEKVFSSPLDRFCGYLISDTKDNILNYYDASDIYNPCIFMDDIEKMSPYVNSAQDEIKRIEDLVEKKFLSITNSKSMYMVIYSEEAKRKLKTELQTPWNI